MSPSLVIETCGTVAGGYVLASNNTVLAAGAIASEGDTPSLAAFQAGAEAAAKQGITAIQVHGIERRLAAPPENVVVQFTDSEKRFSELAAALASARAADIALDRDLTTDPSAPVLNPVHIYSDAAYDHSSSFGQIGYIVLDGVGVVRDFTGRKVESTSIRELEYTAALEAARSATTINRADELRFVTDNWQTSDALNPDKPLDTDNEAGVSLHRFMTNLRGYSIDVVHSDRSSVGVADTLATMAATEDVEFMPHQ